MLGFCDGESDWSTVGKSLDEAIGFIVGILLGAVEGTLECFTDGSGLGAMLGLCEGKSDCKAEGKSLDEVICFVGIRLGSIDGTLE